MKRSRPPRKSNELTVCLQEKERFLNIFFSHWQQISPMCIKICQCVTNQVSYSSTSHTCGIKIWPSSTDFGQTNLTLLFGKQRPSWPGFYVLGSQLHLEMYNLVLNEKNRSLWTKNTNLSRSEKPPLNIKRRKAHANHGKNYFLD